MLESQPVAWKEKWLCRDCRADYELSVVFILFYLFIFAVFYTYSELIFLPGCNDAQLWSSHLWSWWKSFAPKVVFWKYLHNFMNKHLFIQSVSNTETSEHNLVPPAFKNIINN